MLKSVLSIYYNKYKSKNRFNMI